MRGDANAMGNARRLFEAQSKDAYQRNGRKCVCELHEQKVRVPTKKLGVKNVNMSKHGVIHLSSCPHSEMARTCWDDQPKHTKRTRLSVTIELE